MSQFVSQIDRCLKRYYDRNGVEEYHDKSGTGKFKMFCDDNGFDDDNIEEEMREIESIDQCQLLEFDKQFPFPQACAPEDEAKEIYRILKICYEDENAFNDDLVRFKPIEITRADWNIQENDIQDTIREYSKQLSTIFDQQMQSDKNILKILSVGRKKEVPYLQYLTDMYCRDRIAHPHINSVTKWASKNKHMIQLLQNQGFGKLQQETAKTAIESFFHRICPLLSLKPQFKIEDSLQKVSQYIFSVLTFVYNLARGDRESCPFQLDACIIFNKISSNQCVVTTGIDNDSDSEDDEYDDDDDIANIEMKDEEKYCDSIGCITDKLDAEKILYLSQRDGQNKHDRSIRMRLPYYFQEFKNRKIGTKYKGVEFMQYPRNKRVVSIIDRRRDEEKETDDDELIFLDPPDICNSIPNKAVPEWYFDASRTCIIPNIGYENGKHKVDVSSIKYGADYKEKLKKQTIVSNAGCNGALMLLSFHVISSEEIKCYLHLNGTITRFFPSDILHVLPLYFSSDTDENEAYAKSSEVQDLIEKMSKLLRDYKFEAFYNEYKVSA